MAIRLTGTFFDINGAEHRVDLYDADFSGSSSSFDVKYCTINYQGEGDDINTAMEGSRASIGMSIPYQNATLTTFITDLTTGEEGRFWVQVTKVATSLTIWRGIITPDFSAEQDTAPYFEFNLSAVCGLATLKKIPYHDGTALYEGIERFTKHIVTALTKLSHESMWGGSDIFIKTAIDWWEASMSSGATDDAMYQGGVEHSAFYRYGTAGDVDNDVISCYDVIRQILEGFNARILQVEGVWWIEQIPYRSTSPYYTRHYSKSGAYLSNATNSGANVIDQTKTGAKLATVEYDYLPALRKVEIYYNIRTRRNYLAWWTSSFPQFNQKISSNGGDALLRLEFAVNWTVSDALTGAPGITGNFLMARFTLKIGSNYLKRGYSVLNFSYYVDQPEWSNTLNYFYVPINVGVIPTDGTTVSGTAKVEIITPPLPADGSSNTFDYLANYADYVDWFGDPADIDWYTTSIEAVNPYLEIYEDGAPVVGEDKRLYPVTNPNSASEVYEKDVYIGNAPVLNGAGAIQRWNGSSWVNSGLWGQGVETRNKHLPTLIGRNIMNARLVPLKRMNGQLLGDFRINRLIQTSEGKKWMMQDASWDVSRNTISGTWFNLDYGTAGVSSTPIKIKINPSGTEPTIDPAPPNGGITTNSPGLNINPAPTVLKSVAFNDTTAKISKGATVTSIGILEPATGKEFLAGDFVTILNPITGQYQSFEISSPPALGATSLSVVSDTADFEFPQASYLLVKQNAFSFRLPSATQGQILRYNDTTDVWEAYSGATDGHVLTWDTTNGWQAEAASGGGGGITALTGDVTATGPGSVAATIANDAVTTVKILNSNVTTGKIADDAVTAAKIASDAVTTVKILNSNVTTGKIADDAVTAAKIASDAVTTVKILNSNVTTGKIADDAVTLAKLQNAVAANIVLGNIGAAGAIYAELTPANLYTLLSLLNGAADRVPFYTGANAMSASENFKYFSGTKEINVGGGASLDGRFVHRDSANINGNNSAFIGTNNVAGVYSILLQNTRNVAGAATKLQLFVGGTAVESLSADPFIEFVVQLAGNTWTMGVDNSDGDKFKITPKSTAPGSVANSGISITSAAKSLVGINKDAPAFPLDVGGTERTEQFHGINAGWVAGDFSFGLGAGTAPTFTAMSGTHNFVKVEFSTGTAPSANDAIFTITRKTGYGFATKGFPVFSAANDKAAAEITKFYIQNDNGTQYTMVANGTLTASTPYKFHISFSGY